MSGCQLACFLTRLMICSSVWVLQEGVCVTICLTGIPIRSSTAPSAVGSMQCSQLHGMLCVRILDGLLTRALKTRRASMLGMSFSAGIHCVAAFSFSVFRGDCSSLMAFCLGL